MNIVLDTNVLITILSKRSPTRWIFEEFLKEAFTLCVTTDMLDEYAEILGRFFEHSVVEDFMQIIEEAENVLYINKFIYWNLITADPDDNKFVDCAVACNAKYIVTEDKHFNVLQKIEFPKVEVIGVKDFKIEWDKLLKSE